MPVSFIKKIPSGILKFNGSYSIILSEIAKYDGGCREYSSAIYKGCH